MAKYSTLKKAKILSLVLFLIGIALITLFDNWWPGIMLAVGIPLAVWQYILGRHYDMAITLFVFLGTFITVQFDIKWQILLPVLFTIGGIYIFFREYLESRMLTEEQEAEEEAEIKKEEEKK